MNRKSYQDLSESIKIVLEWGSGVVNTVVDTAVKQGFATGAIKQPTQAQAGETLAKQRGVQDFASLPQWRKDAFAANEGRRGMQSARAEVNASPEVQAAQEKLNAARTADASRQKSAPNATIGGVSVPASASADVQAAEKALRDVRTKGLAGSKSYQSNLATFKQYHTETNPIKPVERNGGGFSMGRGVGGRPVVTGGSYVNPNSPEGRLVNAGVLNANKSINTGYAERDQFGPLNTPTGRAAELRDTRAKTQRQLNTMRTIDRFNPRVFNTLYPPNSPIHNADGLVY